MPANLHYTFRSHPVALANKTLKYKYSGASVHELNPFLEAVREPKCS
jgi:hypothetical protein